MGNTVRKQWDEYLVAAWQRNQMMFFTTIIFLERCGITKERLDELGPKDVFAELGINHRSPKNREQLHGNVKAFFKQFFPNANELLWQGKEREALGAMRRYKVGEDRLSFDRELRNSKKDARTKSSSQLPALIPGTNVMHIQGARRTDSDWGTVKPPSHRRMGYRKASEPS
jgi:hypothetical protein